MHAVISESYNQNSISNSKFMSCNYWYYKLRWINYTSQRKQLVREMSFLLKSVWAIYSFHRIIFKNFEGWCTDKILLSYPNTPIQLKLIDCRICKKLVIGYMHVICEAAVGNSYHFNNTEIRMWIYCQYPYTGCPSLFLTTHFCSHSFISSLISSSLSNFVAKNTQFSYLKTELRYYNFQSWYGLLSKSRTA